MIRERSDSADTPLVATCARCGHLTANLSRECRDCLNRRDFGTPRDPRWRVKRFKRLACGEVVELIGQPKALEA